MDPKVKEEPLAFIFPAVSHRERLARSKSPSMGRSRSRSVERICLTIERNKRVGMEEYARVYDRQLAKNEFLTRLLLRLESELRAVREERETI